jgi:uncharacterized membrane protein
MTDRLLRFLRKVLNKVIHSIAFMPLLIGCAFLGLAEVAMQLDQKGVGERLNARIPWLSLEDTETALATVTTVITGLISLIVFSFSMVLLVMNQAITQLSNRILNNFIGERVQKWVLSIFTGTVIYALFLLLNINRGGTGGHAPSLSVYLLVFFTVFDIFLFVYFLHYITQSFRYEQLIHRIHNRTKRSLQHTRRPAHMGGSIREFKEEQLVLNPASGYYQGFALHRILTVAARHDVCIRFLHPVGTYLLKDVPLLIIRAAQPVNDTVVRKLLLDIDFYYGKDIDRNPYYGLHHLTEVGIKALSPGINDPGTAVISLNAIANLLCDHMAQPLPEYYTDPEGVPRIFVKAKTFVELFEAAVLPVWDYGRKDRIIQSALVRLTEQLKLADREKKYHALFDALLQDVVREQQLGFSIRGV